MNIFALDLNPKICASYYVDRHTVKMPTEQAQMLSFIYYHKDLWDGEIPDFLMSFSKSHDNHPCSLWMRESLANFIWSCELGIEIVKEYRFRFNSIKHQRALDIFQWCLQNPPNIPNKGMTPFVLTMPEDFKTNCQIESYRNLYRTGKNKLHKWSNRLKPNWI